MIIQTMLDYFKNINKLNIIVKKFELITFIEMFPPWYNEEIEQLRKTAELQPTSCQNYS